MYEAQQDIEMLGEDEDPNEDHVEDFLEADAVPATPASTSSVAAQEDQQQFCSDIFT